MNVEVRPGGAMLRLSNIINRYKGVKNEKGVWITPAFPKLIYVLEEDIRNVGNRVQVRENEASF